MYYKRKLKNIHYSLTLIPIHYKVSTKYIAVTFLKSQEVSEKMSRPTPICLLKIDVGTPPPIIQFLTMELLNAASIYWPRITFEIGWVLPIISHKSDKKYQTSSHPSQFLCLIREKNVTAIKCYLLTSKDHFWN